MTHEQKKVKILGAISERGWFTDQIYFKEASELRAEGKIKLGDMYFPGGNLKPVWVAA